MLEIKPIAMRDALIKRIWEQMKIDNDIFFVSADFGSPVLDNIRQDFPERFINVGVAEQNMINVSVGLALEGFKVFLYAIAPFIPMRCYEQIRVNIALLSEVRPMNINLIGVGAGVSYSISGPTHQCYEDISLMRAMPNFAVLSPSDHISSGEMFDYCIKNNSPKYLRLDVLPLPVLYKQDLIDISLGFYELIKGKGDFCIVSTGFMTQTALKVSNELGNCSVFDFFNLTHFNKSELSARLSSYKKIITLEEGFGSIGGLDSVILSLMIDKNVNFLNIGVDSKYTFKIGKRDELHNELGISKQKILTKINKFLGV